MKMMFSANPRTHGFVTMGPQTQATAAEALETNELTNEPVERCLKKRRVCPDCEVTWRREVQSTHPEGSLNPAWSSKNAVVQEMKKANKGTFVWEKAIHWQAACRMIMNHPNYKYLSKEDKHSAKTAACRDLAAAFHLCIGTGRFFQAFSRAGRREKIAADLWERAETAYTTYFENPTQQHLWALELLEEELGRSDDYIDFNGNLIVPEILQALDFHNGWGTPEDPCGITVYDICRRGGAQWPCGVLCSRIGGIRIPPALGTSDVS